MDNRANWVLFLGNSLPGYGINAAVRSFTYLCTPVGALFDALSVLLAQAASNHCIVVRARKIGGTFEAECPPHRDLPDSGPAASPGTFANHKHEREFASLW